MASQVWLLKDKAWAQRQGLLIIQQHRQNLVLSASRELISLPELLGWGLAAFLGGVLGSAGPWRLLLLPLLVLDCL